MFPVLDPIFLVSLKFLIGFIYDFEFFPVSGAFGGDNSKWEGIALASSFSVSIYRGLVISLTTISIRTLGSSSSFNPIAPSYSSSA